jgi:hypothetical protein
MPPLSYAEPGLAKKYTSHTGKGSMDSVPATMKQLSAYDTQRQEVCPKIFLEE